jgi:hypothetical protein
MKWVVLLHSVKEIPPKISLNADMIVDSKFVNGGSLAFAHVKVLNGSCCRLRGF